VFALIIFFWAQAVRLPRQGMLDMVERQSLDEKDPDATAAEAAAG
jgi:hypothetical protein